MKNSIGDIGSNNSGKCGFFLHFLLSDSLQNQINSNIYKTVMMLMIINIYYKWYL